MLQSVGDSEQRESVQSTARLTTAVDYSDSIQAQLVQAAILEAENPGALMNGARLGSAVAVSGDLAVVGAPGYDLASSKSGAVFLFHRIGSQWVEEARLSPADGTGSASFGAALALDGDLLAVGAPWAAAGSVSGAGAVYLYSKASGDWVLQAKVTAVDASLGSLFGSAVALNGQTLAVGAPSAAVGSTLSAGAVYVFSWNGLAWTQEARVTAPAPTEAAGLGRSVAIGSALVVAGAPSESDRGKSQAGAVYVMSSTGGAWGVVKRLVPDQSEQTARFGTAVSLDQGLLGVGAPGATGAETGCGAVYPFFLDGDAWSQGAKLQSASCGQGYALGTSVAVEGGVLVAGAPGPGTASGPAGRVHVWTVGSDHSFSQVATLAPTGGKNLFQFGAAAALSHGTILAGGPSADYLGAASGAAWVFAAAGGAWTQQAQLLGEGSGYSDQFAHAVAVDGDTVVVGAALEDLPGKEAAGAAYVFTHGTTGWQLEARLTASDAAAQDQFGFSVAVSGDTVVVGAWMDDDRGKDSGSAYVFERSGGQWQQKAKLTGSQSQANDFFGASVAAQNGTVVVGSAGGSSTYVYTRSNGSWQQQQRLAPFARPTLDYLDAAVSISGDTIAVAALPDSQAAYVFVRQGTSWVQQARLTSPEPGVSTAFGEFVAVHGDNLVVGAPSNSGSGSQYGRAYVFERSGTAWQSHASLSAPGAAAEDVDLFGGAVAAGDDGVYVGAPWKVVAGTQSGAVYRYLRQGDGSWTLASTFTPSSPKAFMDFGYAVAVASGTLVVGAPTATNSEGAAGAGVATVYSASVPAPAASFSWSPTTVYAGAPVQFTDTSTQNPASWLWEFGDDATSTVANPIHIFVQGGAYSVKLTVSNAAGSASATQVVTVTGAPPVAGFAWSPATPGPGAAIQFRDTSTNQPVAWQWVFGDGTSSTLASPPKTYAAAGSYTVSLTVSNPLGSDTVAIPLQVQVGQTFTPTSTIPSVARMQGVGAFFTSRVDLFNAGTSALGFDVVYTPRADIGGSSLRTRITVPSGLQLEVDDPLRAWFGMSDADRGVGTLRLAVPAGRENDAMVQSVVYARNPDGSEYGQLFPAIPTSHALPQGARAFLSTTVDAVRNRINLGVVGLVDGTSVTAVPVDPLGTQLAAPRSFALDAGVSRQLNDLNRGSLGFALGDRANYVVQLDVARGTALGFVSVLDGTTQVPGTSDPTTILPVVTGSTKQTLVGVGPAMGINEFSGSASVTNTSNLAAVIRADFYARDDAQHGIAKTATLNLAAGETKGFSDIVGELFGTTGVGVVVLTSQNGAELFATGREFAIYRDKQGQVTGTAGDLVPALRDSDLLVSGITYEELGLRERTINGALERSNLLLFNPGAQQRQVTLSLFDGATGASEGQRVETIPPGEMTQLNRVISRIHPAQDGQPKRLEVVTDGPLFVTASRVNKDGDPVTVMPQAEGGTGQ